MIRSGVIVPVVIKHLKMIPEAAIAVNAARSIYRIRKGRDLMYSINLLRSHAPHFGPDSCSLQSLHTHIDTFAFHQVTKTERHHGKLEDCTHAQHTRVFFRIKFSAGTKQKAENGLC